mgnify:CR=1 FL=1
MPSQRGEEHRPVRSVNETRPARRVGRDLFYTSHGVKQVLSRRKEAIVSSREEYNACFLKVGTPPGWLQADCTCVAITATVKKGVAASRPCLIQNKVPLVNPPVTTDARAAAPELLAPAGDWPALRATIAGGADAVYFGLRAGFNARARAANFAPDELGDVMAELRGHSRRGYLTLNTLVFSNEWPALEKIIRQAADAGVDAVLVQDFGAARLIRAVCPSLELHASTQMTLASAESIEVAQRLGIARVVLPRELTIEQILAVRRACTLGLEVFVHGALCVSFSGQCAASLSLGGRSANRGQCAQACRLPYRLLCDGRPMRATGSYPLSPNDLAALDLIPRLIAAGVDALKIEGRMKGPDYVFGVASAYRQAIDRCTGGSSGQSAVAPTIDPSALPHEQSQRAPVDMGYAFAGTFSRGFSHGWLECERPPDLVAGQQPGHRGQPLGTIEAVLAAADDAQPVQPNRKSSPLPPRNKRATDDAGVRPRSATNSASRPRRCTAPPALRIRLSADLALGDGIAISCVEPLDQGPAEAVARSKHRRQRKAEVVQRSAPTAEAISPNVVGGRVVAITTFPGGQRCQRAAAGQMVVIALGRWPATPVTIRPGMAVFKTDDSSAQPPPPPEKMAIAVQVRAVAGGPLTLTAQLPDGRGACVSSSEPLVSASRRPTDSESVAAAVSRFGDTPFAVRRLEVQVEGSPLVPLSLVNRLRRELIAILLEVRKPPGRPTCPESPLPELRRKAQQTLGRTGPADDAGQSSDSGRNRPSLVVLCRSIEQVAATIEAGGRELIVDLRDTTDWVQAERLCRQSHARWMAAVPRIHKPGESLLIERLLELQPDGVLARNLASLALAASRGVAVAADYSLNAVNELSAAWLIEQGASMVTAALDAHLGSVDQWIEHFPAELLEMVLHLHVPMFHTAYCPFSAESTREKAAACPPPLRSPDGPRHNLVTPPVCPQSNDRPQPAGLDQKDAQEHGGDGRRIEARSCLARCRRGRWGLSDRLGIEHTLWPDTACRTTVFHAWPQSAVEWAHRLACRGIGRFRIEWPPQMPIEKLAPTLAIYRDVLDGRCDGQTGWRRLRELYPSGLSRCLRKQHRPDQPPAKA